MSLKIENLNAYYGEFQALKQLSLEVVEGKITALVGPNGAGKSSLIRVLSGVFKPQSGSVHWQGQDLLSLSPRKRARLVSVVSQAQTYAGAFSVAETVLLGRTAYMGGLGNPTVVDMEVAEWAMRRTGVAAFALRHIAELSGGEQQRVLLARALAQDTPLLLMDEPTNHLDLKYQLSLLNLINELVREKSLTVLVALHDLNLVSLYADHVVLMDRGQIVSEGAAGQVLSASQIQAVYGAEVQVIRHPQYGTPMILPVKKTMID